MTITAEPILTTGGDPDSITVRTTFHGVNVDRPEAHGYSLGPDTPRNRKLAQRLMAAIRAGVVFTDHEVRTDINHQTFVGYRTHVLGRRMNADLKRLGF